jgi:hypothetical protein
MPGCGVPAGELAPGEMRTYDCTLSVLDNPRALAKFVRRWG